MDCSRAIRSSKTTRHAKPPRLISVTPGFSVRIARRGAPRQRVHAMGRPKAHDGRVEYWKGNQRLAVATVNRDRASLQAEAEMEAGVR